MLTGRGDDSNRKEKAGDIDETGMHIIKISYKILIVMAFVQSLN